MKIITELPSLTTAQVGYKIKNQPRRQDSDQIWDCVANDINDQVSGKARGQVDRITEQARNQIWTQIWSQVRN